MLQRGLGATPRRLGLGLSLVALLLAGCSGSRAGGRGPASDEWVESVLPPDPGTSPTGLEFLYVLENTRSAPYFPIEGIGGVAYGLDGTLIFCDEKGGRVHGLDPGTGDWYLFDSAPDRPYRPVDVQVDGFSVLVLDMGSRMLLRFDMNGTFQDRLLNFRYLDPVIERLPVAFDVDQDGRMVFTEVAEQQVLLLDSFLNLTQTLGEPGSHREQFQEPSGVAFLPDGGFLVADRGNRRLQRFNRLGYFDRTVGGEFELRNPLVAPQGISCDRQGNAFVADPASGIIHVYDRKLNYLFGAGSEMGLLAAPEIPLDVAAGPDHFLAVTDRGKQAVLVYRILYD